MRRSVTMLVLFSTLTSGGEFFLGCHSLTAGDWPQILGPTRNGVAANDEKLVAWSSTGPKLHWEKSVGQGLAGVAVANERVVLFHRDGDREVIAALATTDGEQLWESDYPTNYRSGISPDSGPRCVPVIDGETVITFGAEGVLTCLELRTGKTRWTVDSQQMFRPPPGYFGVGSTPVVVDDKVIVNVGARGAGVVAFDKADGKVLWKATDEAASYSAPTTAEVDGKLLLLMITRLQFLGLDPKTGKEVFRIPFGMRGPTVNGATPIVVNGHAFLTASYGIGALLAKLDGKDTVRTWSKPNLISSQYVTPVPLGTTLFAADGRDDAGGCDLVAFDAIAGVEHWRKRNFGYASVTRVDDKLITLGTEGTLVLVEANSTAYKELARTQLFDTTTRALPALANGRLYTRDTKTLKCVQVGIQK